MAAGARFPPESQENAIDSGTPEKSSRRDYSAQVARIVAGAAVIFGSQALFEWWLVNPAIPLNRQRPIDLLETSSGVDILSDHLTRIEHGVCT
jgi:putative toxin-antitoxin system antitoxin component (TIGR02293 family)